MLCSGQVEGENEPKNKAAIGCTMQAQQWSVIEEFQLRTLNGYQSDHFWTVV